MRARERSPNRQRAHARPPESTGAREEPSRKNYYVTFTPTLAAFSPFSHRSPPVRSPEGHCLGPVRSLSPQRPQPGPRLDPPRGGIRLPLLLQQERPLLASLAPVAPYLANGRTGAWKVPSCSPEPKPSPLAGLSRSSPPPWRVSPSPAGRPRSPQRRGRTAGELDPFPSVEATFQETCRKSGGGAG